MRTPTFCLVLVLSSLTTTTAQPPTAPESSPDLWFSTFSIIAFDQSKQ